jgi:hypothetical protein
MIKDELLKKIRELSAAGKSREDIYSDLINDSYELDEINENYLASNKSRISLFFKKISSNVRVESKGKILLTGFIICAVVVLAYLAVGEVRYYRSPEISVNGKSYHTDVAREFVIDGNTGLSVSLALSSKLDSSYSSLRRQVYAEQQRQAKKSNFSWPNYWGSLVKTDEEDVFLKSLIDEIGEKVASGQTAHSGPDATAYYTINLVQGLPYDHLKYTLGFEDTKLPYETLYTGTGVCRETAPLLAKMLSMEGYESAIITSREINHALVGVKCGCVGMKKIEGYCALEATGKVPIGETSQYQAKFLGVPVRPLKEGEYKVTKISGGKLFNCSYD